MIMVVQCVLIVEVVQLRLPHVITK